MTYLMLLLEWELRENVGLNKITVEDFSSAQKMGSYLKTLRKKVNNVE